MSKDRYRPLFCTADYYINNQSAFKLLKNVMADFSDIEKVKTWTIALTCLRRSNDWFGGARAASLESTDAVIKSSIKIKTIFEKISVQWPAQIDPDIDIQSFLNAYRIKPLPESALRSLYFLGSKNYPLMIMNHEPTPFELLQIQLTGQRIITFDENYESWPTKIYGERDPLSFIIHDLIHADHFLKDRKQHQGQIGFYKCIDQIKSDDELLNLLTSDSKFKSGFEYIISDMNAHPVHLFQTLKALLFLTVLNDDVSERIWSKWAAKWIIDALDYDAVQKINTQLFSNINANQIENMCFKKSFETSLARPN